MFFTFVYGEISQALKMMDYVLRTSAIVIVFSGYSKSNGKSTTYMKIHEHVSIWVF